MRRYTDHMRPVLGLVSLVVLLFVLVGCNSTLDSEPPSDNAPPTVTLQADRFEGEATFHVLFEARASDPNGDQLSYTWRVNGRRDTSASGSVASFAFDAAGTFVVAVEVSDGFAASSAEVAIRARNDYRPAGTPDVAIIGFAGRECSFGCGAPNTNQAKLGITPDPGTLNAIAGAFEALGHSVETFSFRSHLYSRPGYGEGYLTADALVEMIRRDWIGDFLNPTRLVLVAHSHGTQFMSLLAYDHADQQFAYGIYLDAVCARWDEDHIKSGRFDDHFGSPIHYPAPLDVTTYACDSLPVPGLGFPQDISDVVPDNVTWGLEVVAEPRPWAPLVDTYPNHRLDGSSGIPAGLPRIRPIPNEGHTIVHTAGSAGLGWVLDGIARNDLPPVLTPGAAAPTLDVPPAPPGFRLDPH